MRRSRTKLTVLLALAGGVGSASAQTDVFWDNPGNGAWGNSANWSPAVVPNNNGPDLFNATLGPVGVPYQVNLNLPVTIESFTISEALATLNVRDETLTINQGWDASVGTIVSTLGGGLITVAGQAVFGDVAMMGAGQVQANGSLKIAPPVEMEICDTDVDYGGTAQAAQWEGDGALLMDMGGSFTVGPESEMGVVPDGDKLVAGDGTGEFVNEGELTLLESVPPIRAGLTNEALPDGVARRGGARVNDTLRFDGASFSNLGGVTVLRGDLDLLEVVNDQTGNGVLQQGRWTVRGPADGGLAIVRFPTRDQVAVIDTRVSLFGPNAQFPAIDGVEVIGASGVFTIGAGRDFQVQDGLTNLGELVVGADSLFDAQSGLNNIDANATLTDGAYTVAGILLTPSFLPVVQLNQARVRLIGQDAAFPAIDTLAIVGTESLFSVELGRGFGTQGNLAVAPGGVLRVGQNSQLNVAGTLNNVDQNVLQFGEFEVGGVLSGGIDLIVEIQQARLALIGPGSQVLNSFGANVLQNLEIIGPQATLEVRDGRTLITQEPLVVQGTLIVDPASGVNPSPPPPGSGGAHAGGTVLRAADRLLVETGAEVRIGVRSSGADGVGLIVADGVEFDGGNAGTLFVDFEPGLSLPDPFVRTIIDTPGTLGSFADVKPVGLDPTLAFSLEDNGSGGLAIRVARACGADVNGDGVLDNGDIGAFVKLFLAGDARADFNADGILDNGDIGAFVVAFLAGCP
ncbi:MAG: GC-type dockerin domain-anchored protein [Phycisphaerales bacterium JB040]